METFTTTWKPRVLSLVRIVSSFLFMQHGAMKLFGFPAPFMHKVDLLSLIGLAGVLELVGGFLLLIGLFTRPVAFILSGQMAFAYFMAHAPQGFWPILNHGELAIMFCFVFLYFSIAGGGSLSSDHLFRGKRS